MNATTLCTTSGQRCPLCGADWQAGEETRGCRMCELDASEQVERTKQRRAAYRPEGRRAERGGER